MINARRIAGIVFGLASLGCLATLLISRGNLRGDSLAMEPPAYRFDGVETLREYDFSVKFHNRSARTVRLLGARETCGPEGCAMITNLPLTVPAGGDQTLNVHFRAGFPGEFTKDTPLFTDDPAQPTVLLRVVGRVKGGAPIISPVGSALASSKVPN